MELLQLLAKGKGPIPLAGLQGGSLKLFVSPGDSLMLRKALHELLHQSQFLGVVRLQRDQLEELSLRAVRIRARGVALRQRLVAQEGENRSAQNHSGESCRLPVSRPGISR